jgi:hypothetical protein
MNVRNAAIVLLVIVVGVLGTFAYYQEASLGEQRRLVQELTTRFEAGAKASNLDLQEKCSLQARREFTQDWEKVPFTSFNNHYNNRLNKCFILIVIDGNDGEYRHLLDAFEGQTKTYADYEWHVDKVKKHWEVPPSLCTVNIRSEQDGRDYPWFCHSSDEFDELINHFARCRGCCNNSLNRAFACAISSGVSRAANSAFDGRPRRLGA